MEIRPYTDKDIPAMIRIWNRVIESGCSFPQEEFLTERTGREWFGAQTYCAVATENDSVVALYCFRPNNVGRCGHTANAHYAVDAQWRGKHIGTRLVEDSLVMARKCGFRIMQFNTVLESNIHARHVYERAGFVQVGTIPDGYRLKDGSYMNICLYYHRL